jgi:hypothetical protein
MIYYNSIVILIYPGSSSRDVRVDQKLSRCTIVIFRELKLEKFYIKIGLSAGNVTLTSLPYHVSSNWRSGHKF